MIVICLVLACAIIPICYICSHILNGLGKSVYSLLITIINIVLMIVFAYMLSYYAVFNEFSVLMGIVCGESIVAIIYILTTQRIISNIEKKLISN